MLETISIKDVDRLPDRPQPGHLYYSEKFRIAAHSCACGCGERVITPIGKLDWSLKRTPAGPSLSPSIGNWNLRCRSHYWIRDGKIIPARSWSQEDVESAAAREREFRRATSERPARRSLWSRLKELLRNLTGSS